MTTDDGEWEARAAAHRRSRNSQSGARSIADAMRNEAVGLEPAGRRGVVGGAGVGTAGRGWRRTGEPAAAREAVVAGGGP